LAVVLVFGCDSSPLERSHETVGTLFASALSGDSTSSHRDACAMNAVWRLPAFPATSRTDTTTIYFNRQIVLPVAQAASAATAIPGVSLGLERLDSLHVLLRIGAPFNDSLVGQLDAATDAFQFSSSWRCPSTFPLATDPTLLAHGYQPDSLMQGPIGISRRVPID
jgi:hypothetical protein